jgi:uncharacterized phiE125 gp8 family phage protein
VLTLVTAPETEPITLTEVRDQCLIPADVTDQDAHISNILIPAVRDRAEAATGRRIITQTWDLVLDAFPDADYIEIPHPPLQSIESVKYRDATGTLQTWDASNYVVEAPAGPRCRRGKLTLAFGVSWPSTYGQAGDVTIRFVCGYGDEASDVPALLKAAMLLDVATLYEHRENIVTGTIVAELPATARQIYRSYFSHTTQRLT